MPNNAMPYNNTQSPAIPNQKQSQSKGEPVKRQPNDHPNQMDKGSGTKQAFENEGSGTKQAFENEGEGSRSAARNYDHATEEYVKSGRVPEAARNAKGALDGPEAEALAAAEEQGRRGEPKGEDAQEEEDDDDE